jgi:hypothetical protein
MAAVHGDAISSREWVVSGMSPREWVVSGYCTLAGIVFEQVGLQL